jgi:hypothetical protein
VIADTNVPLGEGDNGDWWRNESASAPSNHRAAATDRAARRVDHTRQDPRRPGRLREDHARRAVGRERGASRSVVHGETVVDRRRCAGARPRAGGSRDRPRVRRTAP